MIVVDASALVEVLLRSEAAPQIERALFAADSVLFAPHLLDIEVAHVIRRYAAIGRITAGRGGQALADLGDLSIRRYGHEALLPRIWDLRSNLTAYDAAYIALAEALDAPLVTRDARRAQAGGHKARIQLV